MFGFQKVIGPKPDLPDCSLWQCNVCILTTKWLSSRCLLALQRNEYDPHASLKAADLSYNFGSVTTSSDVSLQMYASTYCLTSGGLIQYSCH